LAGTPAILGEFGAALKAALEEAVFMPQS